MNHILKYPRTQHLEGSRLQPGDEDLDAVPYDRIRNRFIVVEEKLDGANAGISFDSGGNLCLQSRGHFLVGGARERHFTLFKSWAQCHHEALSALLGDRYLMYGEWMYAKHTIFYDRLPNYFMEFDILDMRTGMFLGTEQRHALLKGTPISSVPVLHSGSAIRSDYLLSLVRTSLYRSPAWKDTLHRVGAAAGVPVELLEKQTDPSDLMEGLYIKIEEEGKVVERYKYVRSGFLTSVVRSESHWLDRPIVPNQLADGVDIFAMNG